MNKYELQLQTEAIFLGCILHDHTLLEETQLQPKHFVNLQNRELFKAMQDIKKEGGEVSIYTLQHLGESQAMKYGGTEYLEQVFHSVPSIHGFHSYQQNIINFHLIQEAQKAVNEFVDKTTEVHNIKELQTLIQQITKLEADTVQKRESFKDLLLTRVQKHYDSPKSGLSGVDTGYLGLNGYTDGWQQNDLIIIGARPSMGKTALVLNTMLNGCKSDNVMGTFFSIEMEKGQIVDRLIAMEGRINLMKMRNPNKTFNDIDWKSHAAAIRNLEKLNLDIRDEYTIPAIRSAIRKNLKEYPDKKHVVAIDFLTLIKPVNPTGNTHVDVTEIIQDLKQMTKDFHVPIIVLAQLNRGVEQRENKRPTMSDIRESGSIEQIADLIAFLYRDDYYNRDQPPTGITEIIFAKNRNGKVGTVKMKFNEVSNTFQDLVLP